MIYNFFLMLFFELLINVEYENYYPKNKKEIPKANEQKSESKGMSSPHCYVCLFACIYLKD